MSYPTITLKPREGRRLRAGAPWVFSNEIVMTPALKQLASGALVNLIGDDGRAFGTAYFNAKSLISLRLLDRSPDAVIDETFLAQRLTRAGAVRDAIYREPFYRLAHAEGDFLPGLTIDRFGDSFVVQMTTAGMEALKDIVIAALRRTHSPQTIVLRNDAPARGLEGLETYVGLARGEAVRLAVLENGTRYFADIAGGQKTGWYYDQRDNRAFMASLANGRTFLDAYCYTGGFALAAAKAGATDVVGLDSSQPALALAEQAAAENRLSCRFVKSDVFEELERLSASKETFDIVVADPPPFVRARKDLEPGAKAYRKLARLAASVTANEGYLMLASCSHNISVERFALECAAGIGRAGRRARLIRQAGAGADHPIHPMLPESAYLKALVYALD